MAVKDIVEVVFRYFLPCLFFYMRPYRISSENPSFLGFRPDLFQQIALFIERKKPESSSSSTLQEESVGTIMIVLIYPLVDSSFRASHIVRNNLRG
jgi:hypothetical protein